MTITSNHGKYFGTGRYTMRCYFNSFIVIMALTSCLTALAQDRAYKNLGTTPTPEEIQASDTAIGPEGKELPPGSGMASEGARIFAAKCAKCHNAGPQLMAGNNFYMRLTSALVGGEEDLTGPEPIPTVGNLWPYATTVYDYISRAMPRDAPGSLSADMVYALSAFLLFKNGIIKEDEVMDAQTLPKVRMPNRNGFVPAQPNWDKYNECNPRRPECSAWLTE